MITVMVFYTSYAGKLISILSVKVEGLPFKSLEEMTTQTEYKYGVTANQYEMQLFRV